MTWRAEVVAARAAGFDVLDWLSAADDPLTITACLVRSDDPRQYRLLRAPAPVASVADLFVSAAWHECETSEMFGIAFAGAAPPQPLLLPAGSQPPLRKQTALPGRVESPWPGAVDPAKPRRVQRPPGTPWQ